MRNPTEFVERSAPGGALRARRGEPAVILSVALCGLGCATHSAPAAPVLGSTGTRAEAQADSDRGGSSRPLRLEADEKLASEATAAEPSPEGGDAAAALPWPSGTKVLQVGDSFAGALGIPLGKKLEASNVRSILVTKDASYLTDWAWDGNLQKQLWRFNPDLVVITLGANELGIANPSDRSKTVKKIVSILDGRPCVWVAIPLWNGPQNGLLDVIRQNLGHCVYFDTNLLIDTSRMPRIKDGVHPTTEAREAWAELVSLWLKEHRSPTSERVWNMEP